MSKEITTQNTELNSFAAFQQSEVVGLDINSSDITMPKIKLMQATSQEVSKSRGKIIAGQFLNTSTGEATDTIDCVLLDQGKSMVMWPKPFKRGEDALCKSFDGKVKAEGCGDGKCETCQYSSQNPRAWASMSKNDTKPPCNLSYVFLGMDTKTKSPFRLIASGASVKNAKAFINKLVALGVSPFACKVTLTSNQEENDKGVFHVLNFENLRPNDDCINPDGTLNSEAFAELEKKSLNLKSIFMNNYAQDDTVTVDSSDTVDENGGLF